MKTIQDIMSKQLIKISAETTIRETLALMSKNSLRHLPVVDEFSDIVGIVSQRDLVTDKTPDSPIGALISSPVIYVEQDSSLRELILKMLGHKISCVVIRNGPDNPVGIVTTDDILWYLAHMLENNAEKDRSLSDIFNFATIAELVQRLTVRDSNSKT